MARPKRIDYSGARHHVMNRGARRESIFPSDEACGTFLDLLTELPKRYGVVVHGFALMPNHYHLMVESQLGELSEAMAYFQAQYVKYLNRLYKWDGPIFKGRYKNRVVVLEEQWMYLLAYLHLNPVNAGLAVTPAQAHWTSHKYYARKVIQPDWLCTSELKAILEAFGGYSSYLQDVRKGKGEIPADFDLVIFGRSASTSAEPREEQSIASERILLSQALDEVIRASGVDENRLRTSVYGRKGNHVRKVAAYWLLY
jgi:putative transposase